MRWLERMWNDSTRTLYYQVGIGGGNAMGPRPLAPPPVGRHLWGDRFRLSVHPPPAGVHLRAPPGRPSVRTWPAGWPPTSGCAPSCFGPVTPIRRGTCLRDGEDVYTLADTSPSGRLLTTAPFAFYPETQWGRPIGGDGAGRRAGPGPASDHTYLDQAARWATASGLAGPGHPEPVRSGTGPLRAGPADGCHRFNIAGGDHRAAGGPARAQLDESRGRGGDHSR